MPRNLWLSYASDFAKRAACGKGSLFILSCVKDLAYRAGEGEILAGDGSEEMKEKEESGLKVRMMKEIGYGSRLCLQNCSGVCGDLGFGIAFEEAKGFMIITRRWR